VEEDGIELSVLMVLLREFAFSTGKHYVAVWASELMRGNPVHIRFGREDCEPLTMLLCLYSPVCAFSFNTIALHDVHSSQFPL
jgi:hypothetical protein